MSKDQPNKPGADPEPGAGEDEQAVETQGTVSPDDYPKSVGGKPNYKDRGSE